MLELGNLALGVMQLGSLLCEAGLQSADLLTCAGQLLLGGCQLSLAALQSRFPAQQCQLCHTATRPTLDVLVNAETGHAPTSRKAHIELNEV